MLCKRVKPTTNTYGIIMDGLFRAGRNDATKKMFHEMIKSGTTMSISAYAIILGGVCRNTCTDEAIVLLHKLGAMNMKFNITIFYTVIDAMYNVHRREEAQDLFAAIPANGLVPNASTYGLMI
jgi:pentatricopeptide repeat protein